MAEVIDNLHGWLQELLGAGMRMPCIVFTSRGAGMYPPGGHVVAKYDAAFSESPQVLGPYQPGWVSESTGPRFPTKLEAKDGALKVLAKALPLEPLTRWAWDVCTNTRAVHNLFPDTRSPLWIAYIGP